MTGKCWNCGGVCELSFTEGHDGYVDNVLHVRLVCHNCEADIHVKCLCSDDVDKIEKDLLEKWHILCCKIVNIDDLPAEEQCRVLGIKYTCNGHQVFP